jgi:hypothetical protein
MKSYRAIAFAIAMLLCGSQANAQSRTCSGKDVCTPWFNPCEGSHPTCFCQQYRDCTDWQGRTYREWKGVNCNHPNCKNAPRCRSRVRIPRLPILDRGPFPFGLIVARDRCGRRFLIAATEADFRRSESIRLGIPREDVQLSPCRLGSGGNYCIGDCENEFDFCLLYEIGGHFWCSCN